MRKYGIFYGVLSVALTAPGARAATLLKPVSGPVQVLRPRALDIETRFDGAWARTTVTTLFARKSKQAIEADLLYQAPPGCIVTGFAYWHGREKVTARVTERERAEALGEPSPTSQVDPSWVQLVGKNVFRARLHSILPGRDLRVEVQLAQPLDGEGAALVWKYPLIASTRDITLDWLRLRASVSDAYRTRNNLGASVAQEEITLKKYNFKPKNDARIAVPLPDAPLRAQLTTEHVVGADGAASNDAYFALTLSSAQDVAAPPRIEGVETFDLTAAQRPSPGEVRWFGRYRGKGAATVTWGNARSVVWFAPASDASHEVARLAAPLWGAQQLDAVAGDGHERARSIGLSKRFNILSKWTSYVAIPAQERVVIEARLQQSDLERRGAALGRAWATQVEAGTPLDPAALQARAALRALMRSSLGRKYAFDEETARESAVKTRLGQLARLVMAVRLGIHARDRADEARLQRLSSFSLQDAHPYLQSAQASLRHRQIEKVAADWTRQVVTLRGNTPAALRLKTQLDALQERFGEQDDYETSAYRRAAGQMARAAFAEAVAGRENGPRATQLIDAGERFARRCGAGSFRSQFYNPALQNSLQRAGQQLVGEIEAGRAQSDAARDAEAQMNRLYALSPGLRGGLRDKGTIEWQVDAARRGLARETAYRLAQTRAQRPDDRQSLAALESQLNDLAARTEDEPSDFLSDESARLQKGEPLRTAREFRLEESGLDADADTDDPAAPPTRSEPRLAVRSDEPFLSLQLPGTTRHAEAMLPSGETQDLLWNPRNGRWEARLFAPHFFRAGRLSVGLRTVDAQGRATRLHLNWSFDAAARTWQFGLWSAARTQRATVELPWQQRLALPATSSGQFAALVAVPERWGEKVGPVRLLIVDEKQRRSEIVLLWNRAAPGSSNP